MKRISVLWMLILVLSILTGCGMSGSGNNDGLINMKISVSEDQIDSSENTKLTASFNEAVVSSESWFLFEIRRPDGPVWVRAKYEGNGVYAAETNELQKGDYELYGHLYAGGGYHFSKKYAPSNQPT
ncbi:hypothetical protein [Paenibacillus sp. B01]|uniref:hypothetical protein n=1 Tax=Paenibacillus sp. B01 TaxID=2660554 RepID=UPI00129A408E|nr:hypothetical protein [Paenibacillus sp. B01]QGG55054.1 hypothetical protein GE073_05295 [Paenibacillus sp. B01]